jgi:signal peptidase I
LSTSGADVRRAFVNALLVACLCSCGKEDPNEQANALFVEASKQFSDAAATKFDAAMALYQSGLAKLDLIIMKYPGSNLAVQLAANQMVGTLNIGRRTQLIGSMKPALRTGDDIVVFPYTTAPTLGDIIAYVHPKDNNYVLVDRLVAKAGDRVQMLDGQIHINGKPVKRERIDDFIDTEDGQSFSIKQWHETLSDGASYNTIDLLAGKSFFDNTQVYVVPPNSFFVLGDNRGASLDSRSAQLGYIPSANIVGRVVRKVPN